MRTHRTRRPFRGPAAGPAGDAGMEGHGGGFIVVIARRPPEEEEEPPFDLSSIPTFTEEDIVRMEETEKRSQVEQILAQHSIALEALGRRKVVTAATVAFGLGVAATLLVRGRQPEAGWN